MNGKVNSLAMKGGELTGWEKAVNSPERSKNMKWIHLQHFASWREKNSEFT